MNNPVTLSFEHHKNLKVNPQKAELHGKNINMIPLIISEFANAMLQYPIVLTKNGETGQFTCSALLGFEPAENLFFNDKGWDSVYLPLQIQRQPFSIAQNATSDDNYLICLDTESPAVSANDGQSIYLENGQTTEYVAEIQQLLSHLLVGEKQTSQFISRLTELDLIQPLTLDITFANKEQKRINGLYTIDQQKLTDLKNEDYLSLREQDMLQAIHLMAASTGHLYSLIERKNSLLDVA